MLDALLDDALRAGAQPPFAREARFEVAGHDVPASGLYRGLVLLMLAGLERVGAGEPHRPLFDGLAASLVEDYRRQPWLPSFGAIVYPCDNAIDAAALALHGSLRDDAASRQAGAALSRRLADLAASKPGFPTQTRLDGRVVDGMPRGSAFAWTAAFLAMGGLPEAEGFAQRLMHLCDRAQVAGHEHAACREWPRGVQRGADATSGPILFGYGVGASALALAVTAATGRDDWHRVLRSTAFGVGLGAMTGAPQRFPFESAMVAWAVTAHSWAPRPS